MAEKTLRAAVDLDTKKAIRGAQDLAKTVEETGEKIEDLRTPGKIAAEAIASAADQIAAELERDAQVAAELTEALERIGGDTSKVDAYVGELKRVGLTADDIEADIDELAQSIKRMEDTAKTAGAGADDGLRKVGAAADDTDDKVRNLGDAGDQSGSVLANMVGNSTQDVAALGGIAGTAGMALGQLGEYATEGNIKLSQLGKVAGPMLGVAAAGIAISHVMGEIAESKAFHKENVEAFTESIKAGEDAASALLDRLREAGEVKYDKGGIFGGTADATKAILGAGLTLEQFTQIATGSEEGLERLEDAMLSSSDMAGRMTFSLSEQGITLKAAKEYWSDYQKSVKEAEEIAKAFPLTQQAINDRVKEYLEQKDPLATYPEVWQRIADAMANGTNPAVADLDTVTKALNISVDDAIAKADDLATKQTEEAAAAKEAAAAEAEAEQAARDLALANREAAQAAAAHRYEHDQLKASLSDESAFLSLQDAFDATEDAATRAGEAAAAGGREAEQATRAQAQATIDLKQKVIDYATEVLGLPASVVSDLVAQIDEGKAAEVETWLTNLQRDRNVYFKPVSTGGSTRAFASGTSFVPEDGPAIVGENGIEARNLNKGDTITSNAELRRMLGATTGDTYVTNNTNNTTVVLPNVAPDVAARALARYNRRNGLGL